MGTVKATYRVSGSAALKPEYIEEERSASIIDFSSVRSRSTVRRQVDLPITAVTSWQSTESSNETFADSLKSAFVDRDRLSSTQPVEVAKAVGILAAVAVIIAMIAA